MRQHHQAMLPLLLRAVAVASVSSRAASGALLGSFGESAASGKSEGAGNAHKPGNEQEGLTFFGIADWGGKSSKPYTTNIQQANAQAMGQLASTQGFQPAFIVAAGDNIYGQGLSGAKFCLCA